LRLHTFSKTESKVESQNILCAESCIWPSLQFCKRPDLHFAT
jgi:hypothetical protein